MINHILKMLAGSRLSVLCYRRFWPTFSVPSSFVIIAHYYALVTSTYNELLVLRFVFVCFLSFSSEECPAISVLFL